MIIRDIIEGQLEQARINQAEAAHNEDYIEAGTQTIRVDTLMDLLVEVDYQDKREQNVVNIHG